MSRMLQLVEQMQVRLSEIAASEEALLKALRDALNRADHKLMQDVRVITAQTRGQTPGRSGRAARTGRPHRRISVATASDG